MVYIMHFSQMDTVLVCVYVFFLEILETSRVIERSREREREMEQ